MIILTLNHLIHGYSFDDNLDNWKHRHNQSMIDYVN